MKIDFSYHIHKERLLQSLLEAQNHRFKCDVILLTKKCCQSCEEMNGMQISLQQAIEKMPLPNINCTREKGCFCLYSIRPLRDEDGLPLYKEEWL